MEQIFTTLSGTFTAQDATRDALRARREQTDAAVRAVQRALAEIHTASDLSVAAGGIHGPLAKLGPLVLAIEKALPDDPGAFYRYSDLWRVVLQTCAMVAVVAVFIEDDRLASVADVQKLVGADIRLPVEDYLVGVCNTMPELARLSMNRVIRNDYVTPGRCARFANDVSEGFKQLNLRNDFLRKRYDGIKYDVKRMQEIMYDLSIRGLGANKKRSAAEMDADTSGAKEATDRDAKEATDKDAKMDKE